MTADDYRVKEIREAVMVAGRWTLDVEKLVCDSLDSAYEAGLASAMQGRCRFRIIRWIASHEGEGDWTHAGIGEATHMTRETVTRHLSRLRLERIVIGPAPGRPGYRLTTSGRVYASRLDHLDQRGRAEALLGDDLPTGGPSVAPGIDRPGEAILGPQGATGER